MKNTLLAVLTGLLILTTPTLSWHALGHLTVSRIAAIQLSTTEFGEKAFEWATSLLNPFKALCGEDKHPFTECATWPDKIKEQSWYTMSDWHFTDKRYFKPGYVAPADKTYEDKEQNAVWAIHQCIKHLSSHGESTYGQSKSILGKSISMRNLIHFVGDIHQPLHTTGRVSEKNPDGDMGGNRFYIKHYKNWKWNNLHFIWDHLFDTGKSDLNSPLSDEDFDYLTGFAQGLMDYHTYEELKAQIEGNSSPESWDDEGYQITSTFVYEGLEEHKEIPQEYIQKGTEIVKKRLALAGYRLANVVEGIYKAYLDGETQDF